MKTIFTIVFAFQALLCFSQTDSIYTITGEILPVNVTEIGENNVKYVYPNETASNTIPVRTLNKIKFQSGRIQTFNTSLKTVKGCVDFENVQITKLESEVSGLIKIDQIGAKAKGVTTLSSLSKLQDRTYRKIKIQTAMLGGNVAYIIDQHTEDAIDGGEFGPSKSPSVTISGIAYASGRVSKENIVPGQYMIYNVVELRTNSYDMERIMKNPENFNISTDDLFEQDGNIGIVLKTSNVPKCKDFNVIYADENEMILSGIHTTGYSKRRYYNVFLKRID